MASERLSHVVRRRFVDYFVHKHSHRFVRSISVVPPESDDQVGFVNAGIRQFKDSILNESDKHEFPRICNYQKCIRVGGKNCDLHQVGRDFRHHTFFEMLGNWSFNDYGKEQACEWALDFLVNELKLDEKRLIMTYYSSEDYEDQDSRDIWSKLGITSDRIRPNSTGDNFWEMGKSGPCGKSTEIFMPLKNGELLELWNLVFIDQNRSPETGELIPLKGRYIDTGMGLERVLSVMEGVESNYDTDLFKSLFDVIKAKSPGLPAYGGSLTDELDINYRILADHCRMITVAISDGLKPGRRNNSYDLRSIIKKAVTISRDTFKQNDTHPRYLIFDLVDEVVKILSPAYPELKDSVKIIRRILAFESKRLLKQLDKPTEGSLKLTSIKQALTIKPHLQTRFTIAGRVSNFRPYRSFNFIDLSDGSSRDHIQLVMDKNMIEKPELGSYIECEGRIISSKGQKQDVEFKVEKLIYLGDCNPFEYPLSKISAETPKNCYRRKIHLRPRAPHFASLLRVKSELELSLHMIMKQMNFLRVHTPSITSNDSEASSDLFLVQRTKIAKNQTNLTHESTQADEADDHDDEYVSDEEDDSNDYSDRVISDGYFKKDAFLVTSAQLHLENLAAGLSRVYTLSPCFRAENCISTRHLCEFLMLEAEEANLKEMAPLMNRVETIIKFVAQYLNEISDHKADFRQLIEDNKNREIFEKLIDSEYIQMTYGQALSILKAKTDFSAATNYGCDIGRTHELKLLEHTNNVPIFLTSFPKQLKPFYMKCDENRSEALCFDLIAPWGGEICGGSLREDDEETLIANLNSRLDLGANGSRDFNWYLDSRRFGSFPHGGFGIGFERILQTILGIRNIKDTSAFPRWVGHCPM